MLHSKIYGFSLVATLLCCLTLLTTGLLSFFNIQIGQENINSTLFTGLTPVRFGFNLTYISLIVTYLIWLRQKSKKLDKFIDIIKISFPFLLLAYIAYPLSTDFYLYLHYGLMAIQGFNPYLHASLEFNSVFTPYIVWNSTSSYGLLSMLIFSVSSIGVFIHPLIGIYFLKLLCFGFHLINSFLIWKLLKSSTYRSKFTLAYTLNPALISAFVADVHVDVFLCTSIILLISFLLKKRYILAGLSLVAGFFTKTVPVIWLPLLFVFLLAQRRWKDLGIFLGISLFIVLFASQTFLKTPQAWMSLLNTFPADKTARSLHHIINVALEYLIGVSPDQRLIVMQGVKLIGYAAFFLAYSIFLSKVVWSKHYSEKRLAVDFGWLALFLFLFATPWLMPWYTSILFPIALLTTKSPRYLFITLIFSLCPMVIYGTGSGYNLVGMVTAFLTITPPLVALCCWDKVQRWFELGNFREI